MRTNLTTAANGRRRAGASLVLGGALLALCALAPAADAAFTLGPCAGSAITGRGASFQASAQSAFNANFQSADFCGASAPTVSYEPLGSGAGRRALGAQDSSNPMGARDPAVRFGASDDPPTPDQTDQMQKGPTDASGNDVTAADDGLLHVIPVAVGANAVDVNYPNGCSIPAASLANPASSDQTDRVKLPATQVEAAFYGDTSVDTWGELVPGITGTPTDSALVAAGVTTCAAVPIRRVVRFDDSGTTFITKDWLGKVNPARSPAWSTFRAAPNTTWPNPVNVGAPGTCTVDSNLCKNSANGNGALLDLLNATDGGIGYADVATSRAKGYEMVPNSGDTTFWVPIVNSASAAFEPVADPTSYKAGVGVHGANCANVTFANVPGGADPTLGSWATVSGTGAPSATFYPVCAMTWDLAWDDYAPVYGATAADEAKARTVKDYLTSAVLPLGQAQLAARDYTPLPATAPPGALSLRDAAQVGVSAIKWSGGGGGQPQPQPQPEPQPQPQPQPTPVSNVFTIPSIKTTSSKSAASIKLKVQLPGSGKLSAKATSSYKVKGKTKKVSLGSISGSATGAGAVDVKITVGSSGRKALKKAKHLKVKVKVTYTPTGGSANTLTKTVTLKKAK